MDLVSSWLWFLRKFMEQWSWYQDLWHSLLLILPCNKNWLFISSLCFMSQPFFLFSWGSASHPWLPSCLNSLLWWTKCHLYKSFCLNSSTVSVDLTLRSGTWSLRASRYLTSLLYRMWPCPRQLGVCRQWNEAVSSPWVNLVSSYLPCFLPASPSSILVLFHSLKKSKCCTSVIFRGTNKCIWGKMLDQLWLTSESTWYRNILFFFWGKLLLCLCCLVHLQIYKVSFLYVCWGFYLALWHKNCDLIAEK